MNNKRAAAVLSVLLYVQGLLGFAGLATVLLKERAHAADIGITADMASGPSPAVPR
jgi:hypothetical protein